MFANQHYLNWPRRPLAPETPFFIRTRRNDLNSRLVKCNTSPNHLLFQNAKITAAATPTKANPITPSPLSAESAGLSTLHTLMGRTSDPPGPKGVPAETGEKACGFGGQHSEHHVTLYTCRHLRTFGGGYQRVSVSLSLRWGVVCEGMHAASRFVSVSRRQTSDIRRLNRVVGEVWPGKEAVEA